MGIFNFFTKKSLDQQSAQFFKDNPGWETTSTSTQVFDFFSRHPSWKRLPENVLHELSLRVADRSRKWEAYDYSHALEILVFMETCFNTIETNLLKIYEDQKPPMDSPLSKLWLFAWTFQRLAGKIMEEAGQHAGTHSIGTGELLRRVEYAKSCAEAALICDRYFVTAYLPMVMA